MGKSTISTSHFYSKLLAYQRVYPINIPLHHYKVPLNHYFQEGRSTTNQLCTLPKGSHRHIAVWRAHSGCWVFFLTQEHSIFANKEMRLLLIGRCSSVEILNIHNFWMVFTARDLISHDVNTQSIYQQNWQEQNKHKLKSNGSSFLVAPHIFQRSTHWQFRSWRRPLLMWLPCSFSKRMLGSKYPIIVDKYAICICRHAIIFSTLLALLLILL